MATRFYAEVGVAPDVSPSFQTGWDNTGSAVRRGLTLDTPSNSNDEFINIQSSSANFSMLFFQLVSPPLESISALLAVTRGYFGACEDNRKCNANMNILIRKCDEDGSNATDIYLVENPTELSDHGYPFTYDDYESSPSTNLNLTNTSFNQGDRLIIEIGIYAQTDNKGASYWYGVAIKDDAGSDYTSDGEYDLNCWIETGDTFTEFIEYVPQIIVAII